MKTNKIIIYTTVITLPILAAIASYIFIRQNIKKEIEINKAQCPYTSDRDAYEKMIELGDESACLCVKDATLKKICEGVNSDTDLYTQAVDNCDQKICDGIKDEIDRESCILAVQDREGYLNSKEEKNPENNDISILDYEKIREENPNDVENLINLVKFRGTQTLLVSSEKIDTEETIELLNILEEAKKIEPNNARIYAAEGFIYSLRGENEKALESYKKSLALDPNDMEALLGRAKIYSFIGMNKEAIVDFEKISEIDKEGIFREMFSNIELCKLYAMDSNTKEKALKMCELATKSSNDDSLKKEVQDILKTLK